MSRASIPTVVLGFALALAGCGGGGGSNPPPLELVEITSANAKSIAGAALVSSLEGGNFGAFAIPAGAAFGGQSTQTAQLYSKVGAIQGEQTASLVKQSQSGYMEAAIGSETTACDFGGTVTITGDIADPQTLSAGDAVTLQFVDCDDGLTVVNGTLAMTVDSFSGDLGSGAFSLGVTLELTAFETVENGEVAAANGDVTLTMSLSDPTVTITVSSSSLTVGDGNASQSLSAFALTHTFDQATGAYSIDAAGTVTSSAFDGAAMFDVIVPFAGTGSSNPLTGELLITGAEGATIRVIVLDNAFVRLELDTDGDGTVDEIVDATWDEMT